MSDISNVLKSVLHQALAFTPSFNQLSFVASFGIVFGVQKFVKTEGGDWYKKQIKKPTWTPPNWIFPVMWIPLKTLQSIALWLVLNTTTTTTPTTRHPLSLPVALSIFSLHLALGNYWNLVFMGRKQMKQSLPVMAAFWCSIVAGIAAFWNINPMAGKLFLPTIGWVSVAAKLNWDIAALNSSSDTKKRE